MGVPRDLDHVEDINTSPLVLEFALNFVKPSHVLLIAKSRHRYEKSSLCIHGLYVDGTVLFKSWRESRSKTRKMGLNIFWLSFGIWKRPMEGNEFVNNDKWNEHLALSYFHHSLIIKDGLRNRFHAFCFSKLKRSMIVAIIEGCYVLGVSRGSHYSERMGK